LVNREAVADPPICTRHFPSFCIILPARAFQISKQLVKQIREPASAI
jgi:hypothetical protein